MESYRMASTPLWRCPVCGQTFVSRHMPHSCAVVGLDEFFAGSRPDLRSLFERFVAAASERGPVTVNATKSRIALQVRFRFAGIDRPRKDHLRANFVLTTPVRSERFVHVEFVARTTDPSWPRLREPPGWVRCAG
jgi:hypothetical protein